MSFPPRVCICIGERVREHAIVLVEIGSSIKCAGLGVMFQEVKERNFILSTVTGNW